MHRYLNGFIFFLLVGLLAPAVAMPHPESLSLTELKQRLEEIEAELAHLASYSLRGGSGSVGYTSVPHEIPDKKEWVRIELGEAHPIDQIVLVPCIKRNPGTGLEAEGFPVNFRILAGTEHTTNVVAAFTAEDQLLPRIAPLAVSAHALNASWIAVEATLLSKRDWDGRYALFFSEILAFSGLDNVALQKPVQASSSRQALGWDKQFLVDGFIPYLMDSSSEAKSQAVTFRVDDQSSPMAITIDLETPQPISHVNLHMADLSRTIPQTAPSDYAVPRRLRVTGGNQADFSDQTLLFEYQLKSVYDAGPVIPRRFPEAVCRYVQFQLLELHLHNFPGRRPFVVAFAEIEILSEGRNAALGKPVATSGLSRPPRDPGRLTDGRNFFGKILSMRDWMNQLARRHDLETERPLIQAAMDLRYERQKTNLTRMYWLVALLAAAIGFALLIERMIHRNQLEKMRSRFAADLHDELGANLHAIGLLGDLAKETVHSPDELIQTVDKIRAITERSGKAARHCADIYAAQLCGALKQDMQKTAQRILADIDYDLAIQGEEQLQTLKPRTRADLFLFYKESLVNVSRHSGATRCNIRLTSENRYITLIISDNGRGHSGDAPSSLKRRARLLKAKFELASVDDGGTTITLRLRHRKIRNLNLKARN
ncbi:Sensor histidine kinase LiaS [Pontiella desulfatans]|uniref:Sensor histidine kinase LiaS n=1 Tax=Pontiella desulfatans TaxID=2750659 RepID=A0A6C2TZP4_PONDE|nr:histidine kinase [Pontiella desulfatans]VGO13142.1 Sensor histidine kinase LiaS [Pontiella desulfatans]